VLDVARAIGGDRPREAACLVRASRGALTCAAPVHVPIAARILLVSDERSAPGARTACSLPGSRPRLLPDPERLHPILHLLADLRAAGQDRDLRDNLWHKLSDKALLDRADLTESIAQMAAGNVRPALTVDEERKKRRNRR
jgi:hypothetical protein